MLWYREVISTRNGTSCLPLLNAGFEPWKSQTPNRQRTECPLTNRLSYRGSSKNWTQQTVPMMSEYSAHLNSLLELVHPWHWGYTYLLFDFDNALAQGSDFESKRYQLSSPTEWIWILEVWDTKSPVDWMPTHKLYTYIRTQCVLVLKSNSYLNYT